MIRRVAAALAAILAVGLGSPGRAAPAAGPPVEIFAQPDAFHAVAISADGSRIALAAQRDSVDVLEVFHTDRLADGPTATYRLGPHSWIDWLAWKGDRLVLGVGIPDKSLGFFVKQTRLLSTDEHLASFINLMDRLRGPMATPQIQDDVVSFIPAEPNALLVAVDWQDPSHPGLYRIDPRDGAAQSIAASDRRVTGWLAGADGTPRIAVGDPDRNVPDYFAVRANGTLTPLATPDPDDGFTPVSVEPDGDGIVVAARRDGTDGLYLFSLAHGAYVRTLFHSPKYDVDAPLYAPDGGHVVGAAYVADSRVTAWLDDTARARAERIAGLVHAPDAAVQDQTPNGRFVVALARENGRETAAYWIDLKQGEARLIARMHPSFDTLAPGVRVAVSFKARDGAEIPGYVTLPPGLPGLAAARGLPFVVMPHGGPEARDDIDFDWWAQFVAARGYGVFQPNFRGSTGYGEAFHDAGERAWGETVMDDVYDGAAWLTAQGYADGHRMCVAGWSFGGYVALEAAVRAGGPFRCAVDIAGVADLRTMIDHLDDYQGGGRASWSVIGDRKREWRRLADDSPSHHAADLAMPLLIVHGAADTVVPVEQSHLMRDRLKAAHKPAQYLELDLGDHSLTREKLRLAMLKAMAAFLDANLGAP